MASTYSLHAAAERLQDLRTSRHFRDSAQNALYSMAEYIAQPLSMLLAAPFLVHKLGLDQYGIWMLASAILGSMGILSTGFGDATVKYVSAYRGKGDRAGVERTIRATLTVNTFLGGLFGFSVWFGADYSVHHIFKIDPALHSASVRAIQISAVILLIRSVESVFVSTLRAFERYGPPVKLNVFLRSVVVISAVVIAAIGWGVVAIMLATLFWSAAVVILQGIASRRVVGHFNPLPSLSRKSLTEVFAFGCYSWLQALAGVAFTYADRFLVAAMLGAAPVAIYALCVQVTQPIHGLAAAAFNFLFPHISSRHEAGESRGPQRVFRLSLATCVALSFGLAVPLVLFGKPLLRFWMGPTFASQAYTVLAVLAVAHALLAINIVPHYTLLALGNVRFVSTVNVLSGVISLGAAALLISPLGLFGAAVGRLLYGPVTGVNLLKARARFSRRATMSEAPGMLPSP